MNGKHPPRHFETIRQAADCLGVSEKTIRRHIAAARLKVLADSIGDVAAGADKCSLARQYGSLRMCSRGHRPWPLQKAGIPFLDEERLPLRDRGVAVQDSFVARIVLGPHAQPEEMVVVEGRLVRGPAEGSRPGEWVVQVGGVGVLSRGRDPAVVP